MGSVPPLSRLPSGHYDVAFEVEREWDLNPGTTARLLASMRAGRLVIFCGAGLSMAPPSNLPPAWRVAEASFDKYQLESDPTCSLSLRHDLEAFAQHFADQNTLVSVFIESLVPWDMFVRPSNLGHAAVADFLITRAAIAALSGNYDVLIERYAVDKGFDFQASLDGDQATVRTHTQSPLLKFHGCTQMARSDTVWTTSQLSKPPISDRIAKTKVWMQANLRQKDLLVVGFWSDWAYLNAILETIMGALAPLSVTVIDKADAAELERKAPDLWLLAHKPTVTFEHVQESGADALDELRRAFSKSYLRLVLNAGKSAFETTRRKCEPAWLEAPDFNSEVLYGLRRDAEGVPSDKPATRSQPQQCETLGFFHLRLREAGATLIPEGYSLSGRSIRVVNGAGRLLNQMRDQFIEPPVLNATDIVVAPGALALPLPSSVVRPGVAGSFMRPAAMGTWLDLEGACRELGI